MKRVAVFGATGSIGKQTLDVIRAHSEELSACLLAAHSSGSELLSLALDFKPDVLALTDAKAASSLPALPKDGPILCTGEDALEEALALSKPDIVMLAVSGMAGLSLFASCLERRIPVALANKEAIVAGGDVIRDLWARMQASVYPVDSEHCAFYQCLGNSFDASSARRLWLTASGGPFRNYSQAQLEHVTVREALAHPTWNMGPKITIDSATLANKGLEVIEAHYLFSVPAEAIQVVIQPRSLVHSMIEFTDGSVLAQMSHPDMRLPIQKALLGMAPEPPAGMPLLDFVSVGSIEFCAPDMHKFPALRLAYESIERGMTAVYNAADEEAVAQFLSGKISFGEIPRRIERAMEMFEGIHPDSIEQIMRLDLEVRRSLAA